MVIGSIIPRCTIFFNSIETFQLYFLWHRCNQISSSKPSDRPLTFGWAFLHIALLQGIALARASGLDTIYTTWFLTGTKSYPGPSPTRGTAIVPPTPLGPISCHFITRHSITLLDFRFPSSKGRNCGAASSSNFNSPAAGGGTSRPPTPLNQRGLMLDLQIEFISFLV